MQAHLVREHVMADVVDFGVPAQIVHIGDAEFEHAGMPFRVEPAELGRAQQYSTADVVAGRGAGPAHIAEVEGAGEQERIVPR